MKKVRVGILGCGGFAGAHARKYKAIPEVQIAALCDVSPKQMEGLIQRRLAEVEPKPAAYTDPAVMYRDAKLDAVSILTPHTLHFQHAMQALAAGCHVLVEKPMVTKTADAKKLAEQVRKTGKILQVGYNSAYMPAIQYVRKAIREKTMGKLEMVTGYITQDWKRLTRGTWRHDPALSGGGQSFDSGAHFLNSLCWTVEKLPEEVMAYLDRQDTAVDINSAILAKFPDGMLASLAIGGNCPADGGFMSFLFDDGRIDVDGWGGAWLKAWKGKDPAPDVPAGGGEPNPNANFVDAILGRAEPLCTVDHGVVQCALMEAVYESAASGKPVKVRSA